MNKSFKVLLFIIPITLIAIGYSVFQIYVNNFKVVAAVEETPVKVTEDEVIQELKNDYLMESVNTVLNNKLIQYEKNKLDISAPNEKDLNSMEDIVKESDVISLSKEGKEEFLKNTYYTFKIALENTINSSELEAFLMSENKSLDAYNGKAFEVKLISSEDQYLLDNISLQIKDGKTINEIEEDNDIQFDDQVLSNFNEYGVLLSDLKEGKSVVTSLVEEDTPVYTLLYMKKVDEKKKPETSEVENLKKDYLKKNFEIEKNQVFSYLRGKYKADYSNITK